MNIVKARYVIVALMFSLGCTKGSPSFETLDIGNIPRPTFAGLSFKSVTTATPSATFAIQGECDRRISGLLATVVGISSAQGVNSVAVSGSSVTCASDQKFSFTLKSLAALGFAVSDNRTYEVELRAITDAGVSLPSTIRILYLTPKRIFITSGGTQSQTVGPRLSSGATYQAEVRLGHLINNYATAAEMKAKTSANFIMKSGAAESAD